MSVLQRRAPGTDRDRQDPRWRHSAAATTGLHQAEVTVVLVDVRGP
jgi:hypothetical protein